MSQMPTFFFPRKNNYKNCGIVPLAQSTIKIKMEKLDTSRPYLWAHKWQIYD